MITLYSANYDETIELPKECIWTDEFEWSNVKSQMFYSIMGDLIIQPALTTKGRPVTLEGQNAVIKRKNLNILLNWTNMINHILLLTLHDGRSFNVIFKTWEPPVINATSPTGGYANPHDNLYYTLTIKLAII